jgi:hypothetical protein
VKPRLPGRARVFLAVVAVQNVALGLACLLLTGYYIVPARAFDLLRELAPMTAWGWLQVAVGLAASWAVVFADRGWARAALLGSAAISGMWTAALTIEFVGLARTPERISPMLPLLWLALTGKDLVIAWQPFRPQPAPRTDADLDADLARIEAVLER